MRKRLTTVPDRQSASPPRATAALSRRRWLIGLGAAAGCGAGLGVWALDRSPAAQVFGYEVVEEYPHDPSAYCQGLSFEGGVLYEGTGQYGESTLRRVDLATGRPSLQVQLDRRLFGEGITIWQDRILQLTWKSHFGFIYDKKSFAEVGRFRYQGEGWGLTHDGTSLIMSNGSYLLRYLDPVTFKVQRQLTVRANGQRIRKLNELEFVEGEIFANVWYQDYIVRISPETGNVTGWIDLRNLYPERLRRDRDEVLNGIAFDAATGRLFVTGKNWPKLFQIRLVPR